MGEVFYTYCVMLRTSASVNPAILAASATLLPFASMLKDIVILDNV